MTDEIKKSVLVVDDDDNWRPLLETLLRDEFEVETAATYDTAVKNIVERKLPYHVVVTDIRYIDEEKENEDGLRLVELLNRLGDYTKSIVITGYPSIDTAKRAMGWLAASDYLEKYPASGEFDIEMFQGTVRKAAREAELQRPHGFVAPNLRVLLVEPDEIWRQKLVSILKNNPYEVEIVENTESYIDRLERDHEEYQLVIFDETILKDFPEFFNILQKYLPEAKKIMFTSHDVGEIFSIVQEYAIMNVFPMNGNEDKFDARDFQRTVHNAFAAEATKYAAIHVYESAIVDQEFKEVEHMLVGNPYLLALSLQNERQPDTTPIWLAQRPDKRGRIRLETFIYAAKAKLNPGTEAYWDIPLSGNTQPLITEILPIGAGKLKLSIEIKCDNKWLGTVTKDVDVLSD